MVQSQAPTWKTKDAVDCRQNNKNIKAVSTHHCTATSVLCNCYLNFCAEQSNKDNVHSSATGKQLKQKNSQKFFNWFKPSSTYSLLLISSGLTCGSSTTFHLLISPGPAKVSNFFVRVQHHLPPLDLAWTCLLYTSDAADD